MSTATINRAFPSHLRKRVYAAIEETPQHTALFEDIATYTASLSERHPVDDAAGEPAGKKRKLENGETSSQNGSSNAIPERSAPKDDGEIAIAVKDLSFSIPQRKKYTLEATTRQSSRGGGGCLRVRNQQTGEVEVRLGYGEIEHAFLLPVPEKAQKQSNFIILPKQSSGITAPPPGTPEPILFTVPSGPIKGAFVTPNMTPSDGTLPSSGSESSPAMHEEWITHYLRDPAAANLSITKPSDTEFVSTLRESHRKNDPVYHVKAFRGSKEGYLFFLPDGIFFGFKKPLLFFEFAIISSISYTSVLQRTFNLNISVSIADQGKGDQEFEFSMLDQADFGGIDAYIKRHGLNDASMAASRRAKKLNIKGADGGKGADKSAEEGEDGEEMTELQKAQQEMEDQEDEEEEDYDPGSEGDSDGSGSSSEGEEDHHHGGKAVNGKDLVADELGSEAEEVEITDEEGDEDTEL